MAVFDQSMMLNVRPDRPDNIKEPTMTKYKTTRRDVKVGDIIIDRSLHGDGIRWIMSDNCIMRPTGEIYNVAKVGEHEIICVMKEEYLDTNGERITGFTIPPDAFEEEVEGKTGWDYKIGEWFISSDGMSKWYVLMDQVIIPSSFDYVIEKGTDANEDTFLSCTPLPAGDEPFEIVMRGEGKVITTEQEQEDLYRRTKNYGMMAVFNEDAYIADDSGNQIRYQVVKEGDEKGSEAYKIGWNARNDLGFNNELRGHKDTKRLDYVLSHCYINIIPKEDLPHPDEDTTRAEIDKMMPTQPPPEVSTEGEVVIGTFPVYKDHHVIIAAPNDGYSLDIDVGSSEIIRVTINPPPPSDAVRELVRACGDIVLISGPKMESARVYSEALKAVQAEMGGEG